MARNWQNWLTRLFKGGSRTPIRKADLTSRRRVSPFRIEALEDRVVPAITILDAATGGTLDADLLADGIVNGDGSISRGALTSVPAATNISITAATGGITFNDFAATVTLLTGGGSSATFSAPGGNITFTDPSDILATSGGGLVFTAAGGTLTLGSLSGAGVTATGNGNVAIRSVTSTGAVDITSTTGNITSTGGAFQTPGQLTLSAATGINVSTSAATLQANNSTSGDIVVTQTATPSQLLTITNTAGGVVNNAAGGDISITNLGNGIALNASAIVQTNGGDITLTAQDFIIDTASASINANNGGGAGGGIVTLAATAGAQIDLGTNTSGKLSLTQAELDRVTGSNLRIGSNVSGTFQITAPITAGASYNNTLTLISGAAMTDVGTGAITATNLRLSGTGPITLDNGAANTVTNLVADLDTVPPGGPAGAMLFANSVLLTVGANIDGVTGITSANGDVTLVVDKLNIANPINVGNTATGGIVTLQPLTATVDVDLGSVVDTNAPLEISDAEVDRVTARVLRIGIATGTIDVAVTAPITLGANVPTLSLLANQTITDTGAGSITVQNLQASGGTLVQLDSASNDVDAIAGATTAATGTAHFIFQDADGFAVDTVDGVAGITTDTTVAGVRVELIAGGAVTQSAGADIITLNLALLGTGPYTLENAGNDTIFIAAALTASTTGTLSYADANALTVGAISTTSGSVAGVTTTDSNINLRTVDGNLTVLNANGGADVNAGTGIVTLEAGSAPGQDRALTINANADVIGTGGIVFYADNMSIAATVNAGTNTARLDTFETTTDIDLGGADGPATLGLTDAEIDFVTAGVIIIGNTGNSTSDITITAPIAPAGTNQLELEAGSAGAVIDDNVGTDITVTRLGITAGTGIGTTGPDFFIDTTVSNFEAVTDTGGINLANTGGTVTIGGVNATLSGLDVTTSGDIVLTNDNTIIVGATATEGVSAVGGGSISITNTSNDITVNAPVEATGGNGNVVITAEDDVDLNAAVSAVGTGDITITAEPSIGGAGTITSVAAGTVTAELGDIILQAMDNVNLGGAVEVTAGTGTITVIAEATTGPSPAAGNFSNSGTGTLTTAGGDISIRAGDDISVGAAISAGGAGTITIDADAATDNIGTFTNTVGGTLTTAGGNITITAFDASIGDDINTTTAAGTRVFLLARTAAAVFNLGTNTAFGLTDGELDQITTETLQIGDIGNTGGIQLTGQVSLAPTRVTILSLITDGAVTDNTGTEQPDITVTNLAIQAQNGIGTGGRGAAGDIDIAVTNLAVANTDNGNGGTATGDINIFNTGALTIAANIDGLSGAFNTANLGDITIGTGSPLTVAANVVTTGGGDIDLFTTGANGDLTVQSTATVQVQNGNGNVTLDTSAATSGGNIVIETNGGSNVEVLADGSGNISLFAAGEVNLAANVFIWAVAGGDVTIESNSNNGAGNGNQANRTDSIVIGAGVNILSTANVTLDADPDGNCVGGGIVMPATAIIRSAAPGPVFGNATNVTLNAAQDIVVSTILASGVVDIHSCANILDDQDDTTFIQGNVIDLSADGRIGGTNVIQVSDVFSAATTPTSRFLEAIDFDFFGASPQLIVDQNAAGGNVQLRKVNSPLTIGGPGGALLDLSGATVGPVNQFALISSGGNFNINATIAPPTNLDILIATTGGSDIIFGGAPFAGQVINGTAMASTTVVASGSTAAEILGPANDNAPEISGSVIQLHTTGGDIGTATNLIEINAGQLGGSTNGNGATGGDAFITDVANGVAVSQFNAGTGNVELYSIGNTGTGTNITAVTPNDEVAEIIANVLTLGVTSPSTGATAPSTGNIGQIGNGPGLFFEVDVNNLFASTNDSRAWISALTGTTIGTPGLPGVNVGTNTAFLKTVDGTMVGPQVTGTPDVIAGQRVVLIGENGGFGTPSNALQVDTPFLTANVTSGSGDIRVLGVDSGGLTLTSATTVNGLVSVGSLSASLTVGVAAPVVIFGTTIPAALGNIVNATGAVLLNSGPVGGTITIGNANSNATQVIAGGTATIRTIGAGNIVSGTSGAVLDVQAPALVMIAGGTAGVSGAAINTDVDTLAADANAGDVVVTNTGDLTIDTVTALIGGTIVGVTASGEVSVSTTGDMLVSAHVEAGTNASLVSGGQMFVNPNRTIEALGGTTVLDVGTDLILQSFTTVTSTAGTTAFVGQNNAGSESRFAGEFSGPNAGVLGGTGDDILYINFAEGATLPDDLVFNGIGGTGDELQIDDEGTTEAARDYVISDIAVTRSGTTITIANVESVDVLAGDLTDTFDVTPSVTTAFDIHGSNPTTLATGDTLTVDTTGTTTPFLTTTAGAAGGAAVDGSYTFGDRATVTFDNIEIIDVGTDAVSVTKVETPATTIAIPGTVITYVVTVTNNANVGLTGINLADVVPAAIAASFTATFTGVGSSANITTPVVGNNINQTFDLAAGGVATFTVTGLLDPLTPFGIGTLVNTATVTPPLGVTDDPLNNTATDTNDVIPTGNVVVTKTDGLLTVIPGNSTTYTIVVSNTGPSTVTLDFDDVFPAEITTANVTAANNLGATGGTSGLGDIDDTLVIPAGGNVTYTVIAAIDPTAPAGVLSNTATAVVTTPGWDETVPGDESATDTTTLVPTGDIVVTKTDGVLTATIGTSVTYTITVSNSGPSTVTLPFVDNFPAQITTATRTVANNLGATGGTAGVGDINDTLTIPAGGNVTYTVIANIDPAAVPGVMTNTATATVPGGFTDPTPGNETATDTTTLVAGPDLVVASAAPLNGIVGTPFTYTFTVTNTGPTTAANVVLTHVLPVEAIDITATSTAGTTAIAGGVLTATIGAMVTGATVTVTVTLNPTDSGAFVLTGTATTTTTEATLANNTATSTTNVVPYQPLIVAGPGSGGGAQVRVLNANTGALERTFEPFGPFFLGSMSVAQGDINGDGVPEIIVGAGPGGAPRVVVFDLRSGAELSSFFAYRSDVSGGVNVATGDIDGDGRDDIITGAGAGFGPHVKVFSGATGAEIRSFFAYAPDFTGGVRVGSGDTNGDGRLDIITGAAGLGSPHVKVFDGTTLAELQSFFAYSSGLRDGVFVASADVDGNGTDEILTGAGGGGSTHVKLFDGTSLNERLSFFAFSATTRDGVSVASTDRGNNGRDEIVAGTGQGVQSQVRLFDGLTGQEVALFNAFDTGFLGGVQVG